MKGFYDKMLPAFVKKFGKKYGVKVEYRSLDDQFIPFNKSEGKAEISNIYKIPNTKDEIFVSFDQRINMEDLNGDMVTYYQVIKNETVIKEFLEDEKAALNFLEKTWNELAKENVDKGLQVPYFEIPESMKLDISEKGVPIANLKQNKEMTASSMA